MPKWLKNAFAIDSWPVPTLDAVEAGLVERLAAEIVRRRLSAPALIVLECGRPLNFVTSQLLLFFAPVAETIFPRAQYRAVIHYLEHRGSIEFLCRRIETLKAERDRAAATRNDG